MPDAATVTVTLELRIGADPLSGTLRVGDAPPRVFCGWLQLTSLLQDAADPGRRAAEASNG